MGFVKAHLILWGILGLRSYKSYSAATQIALTQYEEAV